MPGGRWKAREILFRVMFEVETSGEDPLEALEYALGRYRVTEDGRSHALHLLRLWMDERERIDQIARDHLANWELGRLSAVVRTILRLATAELLGATEVPARVVLDQAVELAKKYGEEGADKFINGVLDPIAALHRPREIRHDGSAG